MIVYCIENLVTGKRYIGVTTTTTLVRWNSHVYRALRGTTSKTALSNAIRKYGPENFRIEEIASLKDRTLHELFELEKTLIRDLKTKAPHGYNMTDGGDGTVGYRYTLEQREKIRGRKQSPETIAKRSAALKGKAAHWRGKKLSETHREQMRAAWTPEKRAAQRARMLKVLASQTRGPDGRMQSKEIH